MLLNTLKFAFRIFKQERFFTAINISGLMIGFATCIFILGYVMFEFSYENHISNADDIYRVSTTKYSYQQKNYQGIKGPTRLAQIASNEIPNIKNTTRVYNEICLVKTENTSFIDEKISWVDKDFFNVFKGILIAGDPNTVLDAPLKMVITVSKAKVLFGNKNPIGKTLKVNEGMPFTITGVVKDSPANTHFKYDYINSLSTFNHYNWMKEKGNWHNMWGYTYLHIPQLTSKIALEQELNKIALAHVNTKKRKGLNLKFELQPIKKIHLHSHFPDEIEVNGNFTQLYTIIGVSIILLFIVYVNFINLNTTLSLKRTQNIGVKKVLGSSLFLLKIQFIIEVFLLNCIALIIAIIITLLTHSYVETFFEIHFSFSYISSFNFWILFLLFFTLSIFLMSFYPVFILTSTRIITSLKGKITNGKSNLTHTKQALLSIQFLASIALITISLVLNKQVKFMKNHDLGMSPEHVLVMYSPATFNTSWKDFKGRLSKIKAYQLFKQKLLQNPSIKNVGSCFEIPGQESIQKTNKLFIQKTGEKIEQIFHSRSVDSGFFKSYNVQFLSGTNFINTQKINDNQIIINDKARKHLGFSSSSNAIHQFIKLKGKLYKITGVVKNFNLKSLTEPIAPTLFVNKHPWEFGYYLIKLSSVNLTQQISYIKDQWNTTYPEDPFFHFFSDNYFNSKYQKQEQFGNIFNALTLLAIIIANLGLFAMVSLVATEKLKEVGIKRILGANTRAVFLLMSKDFVKIIIIADTIAIPISWYLLNSWLQNFAYRIQIPISSMLLALAITLIIAFSSIYYFVIKVLKQKPSEIIKNE